MTISLRTIGPWSATPLFALACSGPAHTTGDAPSDAHREGAAARGAAERPNPSAPYAQGTSSSTPAGSPGPTDAAAPGSSPPPTAPPGANGAATAVAGAKASAAASPDAERPTPRCPDGMVDVTVACIDRYEAPNQAGVKPLLMQSQPEAQAWCSERGKRLCTEDEWLRACRGPEGRTYPYGPRYDHHACNQDKPFIAPRWKTLGTWPSEAARAEVARLDQSEPSGSRPTCVTPEGVYDLTANVAEWVRKTRKHPEACLTDEQEGHSWVVMGCYWGACYRKPHEPACDYVNCSHPAGFRSYEFGFRCCRDPQP